MKSYKERTEEILAKAAQEKKRRRALKNRWIAGVSCGLAAVLALNLFLFLPRNEVLPSGPDINEDPPPITDITGTAESYSDIKELLLEMFDQAETDAGGETEGPGWESASPENYVSLAGHGPKDGDEGDIMKWGNNAAFYLTDTFRLQAYSLEGSGDPLGEIAFELEEDLSFASPQARELYLSEDLSAATALFNVYEAKTGLFYTAVFTVETKEPTAMSVVRAQYLSGSLVSSRMAEGKLLVVTDFLVARGRPLNEQKLYVPQTGKWNEMESVPAQKIFLPENAEKPEYTVVAAFSEEGALTDVRALFSFSDDVYISKNALYLTQEYLADRRSYVGYTGMVSYLYEYHTQIVRVLFDGHGTLALAAKADLKGRIHDRFSMDEYENTLRVFSTANDVLDEAGNNGSASEGLFNRGSNVDLSVYDAATMELIARVERFALDGERTYFARFDGVLAYICTADLDDPAYRFDLSDPEHISYTNSGTPAGYAATLAPFGEGLLGIGYTRGFNDLEIRLYDENAGLIAAYRADEDFAAYPANYKAYYLAGGSGLVGLAALDRGDGEYKYLLLKFDGRELKEAARVKIACRPENARAFYRDGTLYIFDGIAMSEVRI